MIQIDATTMEFHNAEVAATTATCPCMHAPTTLLICLEPPRSYFKCLYADPDMAKPEEVFVYMEQEYVLSVRFVCDIYPSFFCVLTFVQEYASHREMH